MDIDTRASATVKRHSALLTPVLEPACLCPERAPGTYRWLTLKSFRPMDIPNIPGVYALYDYDGLYYIGSASKLRARLRGHNQKIDSPGFSMKIRPCRKAGEWLMREYRLIVRLRPAANITHKGGAR